MGALKVAGIVDDVLEILEDINAVYYKRQDVAEKIHEGEVAVGTVRPDALAYEADHVLALGTRQTLPADALRLRDVMSNRGRTGAEVDGYPIRLVSRGALDDVDPLWRTRVGSTVYEYMYDERQPKQFDVTPGAQYADMKVLVRYERMPPVYVFVSGALTPDTQTIFIPDEHKPALVEWALYRLLSRQNDVTQAMVDGTAHYQRFLELLGVSLNTDVNASLKNRFQLN